MSIMNFKKVVFFIKIISTVVILRDFGNLIHDVANNSNGLVSVQTLRKLEKLRKRCDKANLDINFLTNCKTLGVIPKFVCFPIPNSTSFDATAIRRKLLKNAITKRISEKKSLEINVENLSKEIRKIVSGIEWFLLYKAIDRNVKKERNIIIQTHENKLANLTRNKTVPFKAEDTITNLSSYTLSSGESEILKYGLNYALPPYKINKTDVLVSFDNINRYLRVG